jgi:hypothetical protein
MGCVNDRSQREVKVLKSGLNQFETGKVLRWQYILSGGVEVGAWSRVCGAAFHAASRPAKAHQRGGTMTMR